MAEKMELFNVAASVLAAKAPIEFTDGELLWITKHGIRMTGMPAFGITHDDEEIWKIVLERHGDAALALLAILSVFLVAPPCGYTRLDRDPLTLSRRRCTRRS